MGTGQSQETQAQRIAGRGLRRSTNDDNSNARTSASSSTMFAASDAGPGAAAASMAVSAPQPQPLQQPMRHHKHLYLVLSSNSSIPPIRYLGHPGRGPIMFHSRHYLGDAANRGHGEDGEAENIEGFSLRASVAVRDAPRLVPAEDNHLYDRTHKMEFSVEVAPEVAPENPVLVEVYMAARISFVGPGSRPAAAAAASTGPPQVTSEEMTTLGGDTSSAAAAAAAAFAARGFRLSRADAAGSGSGNNRSTARPNSPFGTSRGGNNSNNNNGNSTTGGGGPVAHRIFAKVFTEGGVKVQCTTNTFPANGVFAAVPEIKREGRALPAEAPFVVRLSWGAALNTVLDISPDANSNSESPQQGPVSKSYTSPPAAAVAVGEFQLMSCWGLDKGSGGSSSSSSAGGGGGGSSSGGAGGSDGAGTPHLISTTEPTKLKGYQSRYLCADDGKCFRVDDVFDLAGDDEAAPAAAGQKADGGSSPVRRAGGNDDDGDGDDSTAGQGDAADSSTNIAPAASHDGGQECVICLDNPRNALLLPCRHLCLCTDCAPMLRQQSNKCPVCRGAISRVVSL